MYTRAYSASTYLRCLSLKISIFAIICILGTLVVGQVRSQIYPNSDDDIVFPGPDNSRSHNGSALYSAETQIPVALANRLNSLEGFDDFLQLLHDVPQNEMTPLFSNRFGGGERSNVVRPLPAKCIPELQPVSLKVDNNISTMIFPSCTRIKRCGGCCSSSLLSCQPTAMEVRNFEVIVASVKDLGYKGRQIVPLEEHTKCKCDCRIKEEDCNDKQHYEPHNCQCACNNVDEEQKCRKDNNIKAWNRDLCSCSCRTIEQCSTGYFFNPNTCRCERRE